MEHDHREGTHGHPGYQISTTHSHIRQGSSPRLLTSVIIITPPRASDSDFTKETTKEDPS
jgi:hypothetical protein